MPEYLIFLGTVTASGGGSFQALWKSDGTAAETSAITVDPINPFDLTLGVPYVQMPVLAPVNNGISLYASEGIEGTGLQNLGFSDGAGGQLLSGVAGANSALGLTPQGLFPYMGNAYFSGLNDNSGPPTRDLWSSNGTIAGTTALTASSINPQYLTVAYNKLFFNGVYTDGNEYLFSYDANGAGLSLPLAPSMGDNFNPYCLATSHLGAYLHLMDLFKQPQLFMGGTASDGTIGLYHFDGSVFTLLSGVGVNLQPCNLVSLEWYTAVEHATGLRFPIKIGNEILQGPIELISLYDNFALFFSGIDSVDSEGNVFRGLWTSQGTPATTKKVAASSHAGLSLDPYNLTSFDGKLYFTGNDSPTTSGRGLFCCDSTGATTHIFKSSRYNFNSYCGSEGTHIYNSSWNGSPPPANTHNLTEAPAGNECPFTMAAFGGSLYFNCTGADGDAALYSWDGQLNENGQPINPPVKILPMISNIPQYGVSPYCLTTANLAV